MLLGVPQLEQPWGSPGCHHDGTSLAAPWDLIWGGGDAEGFFKGKVSPHPLTLLGVGHLPSLQHLRQVPGWLVAPGRLLAQASDSGSTGQGAVALAQHPLQHLGGWGG